MFVDKATVQVKAGDGGDGVVSFRHEIYVDKGGPDGGDGGKGGDVVLRASNSQNTLANFRFKRHLTASPGKSGSKQRKNGRSGKDLELEVPVGTVVSSLEGDVLADLSQEGQKAIIAKGGLGGFGNAHFTSSTRQAPKIAERGERGEEKEVTLELKMIADVGLVGLPNAGKSTFLSVTSNARPEIADYPFTTIRPNLGVVDLGENDSLLIADIPGLIEGASEGKGLGDEFLRHVERTAVLLHLIDAYSEDIVESYQTIMKELKEYRVDLSKKPQLITLTKIEGLDEEIINDQIQKLSKVVGKKTEIVAISSVAKTGIKSLLTKLNAMVAKHKQTAQKKKQESEDELPVITLSNELAWNVEKVKGGFKVTGKKIERFAQRTDFENYHGIKRLRDILKKMGIMHELVRQGVKVGDKIKIGSWGSIDY